MGLQKPEPTVTTGPEWAQTLNTLIDVIDAHDHSSGNGAPVTSAGINIDADLEMNGFNLTEARALRMEAQGSTLVGADDKGELYRVGNDLYYNNGSGAAVQITSGTSVVSTVNGAFAATAPGAYPYTVSTGDAQKVLLVDTSADRTINLPAATTALLFCIKDAFGTANTHPVTVVPDGTDTIDSVAADLILGDNFGWWFFISDGVSNWVYTTTNPQTVPSGSMQMFAGASAPGGWRLCNGDAISRTAFAKLFTAIGTTYGVGDGSTTFNIPDCRGRFPLAVAASGTGSTLGGTGGSLDHTHSVPAHFHGMGTGADFNITSGGAHTHSIDHNHTSATTTADGVHAHNIVSSLLDNDALNSGNALARSFDASAGDVNYSYDLRGTSIGDAVFCLTSLDGSHSHGIDLPNFTGTSGSTSHTHVAGTMAGRVGLVTGGVDGNAAMTSGTGNPAFIALNFIIKL